MSQKEFPPNAQQQNAIDHTYGPLRVMAGPGTGKTEVLGKRIAALLKSDAQIGAENILCITYTDAGRIAMRERLTKICGPEIAQAVSIHTFHSFCNTIIQQNADYFKSEQVEPISEITQAILFKKLIDQLPSGHILKPAKRPYDYTKMIKEIFKLIKNENINPQEFIEAIDQEIIILKENQEPYLYKIGANKGTLKGEYYKELNYHNNTRAAVALFEQYNTLMHDGEYYDYDDMILWMIKAFESGADFYFDILERFQYILVDEYQDTNGAQNRLIELLTQPLNESDLPNIFVVGDDDQSIFSFQGANRHNMETLKNRFGDQLHNIFLDTNYRSYQEILDFAERFMSKNTDRIKAGQDALIASKSQCQVLPDVHLFQNPRQEMMYIALEVKKLVDSGVPLKEIAILFRNNADVLSMAKYLNALDIPFYTRTTNSLFEQSLVQKILKIFYYLKLELEIPYSGDGLLFEILHFDFLSIAPQLIATVNHAAYNSKHRSLRAYLLEWKLTQNPSLFNDKPDDSLIHAITKLEKLISIAANESVYVLLKEMTRILSIHEYILAQPHKIELIDQLTAFFNFLEEEAAHSDELNLKGLMSLFDIMKEYEIDIPHHRVFGNRHSVSISTIHKSKGLEYGHVFIANVIAKAWEKKTNTNLKGARIPKSIENKVTQRESLNKEEKKLLSAQEARRLLYVGYTRAKDRLHISAASYDHQNKEQEISAFLYESFPQLAQDKENYEQTLTPEDMYLFEPVDLSWNPEIQLIDEEKIDDYLSKFRMSVTVLNNYLECPLKFYYSNLIKMPEGISDSTSFGSAIHKALEDVYRFMQNDEKNSFPDKEILLDYFTKGMYGRRRNISKEGYKNLVDYGIAILSKYYDEYILTSNKIVRIEWQPTEGTQYKGVPMTGFADKVEFNGRHCNIIDYKTGNFSGHYAKNQLVKADHKKGTIGGNYYRQAVFYKLMMDADKRNDWIAESAEFLFVEPDKVQHKFESRKFTFTLEDEELVGGQIVDVYQKIMNKEFRTGCGKPDCKWCGIVNND